MSKNILSNRGEGVAKWEFPKIHPEGKKFGTIAIFITLILGYLGYRFLGTTAIGWLLSGVTIWVFAFFRDPVRATSADPSIVTSPADGLVTLIQEVQPPKEMQDLLGDHPVTRVSVFMSVFDVHINRMPLGGTVKRVSYIKGKFLNADLDKASEDNERQHFVVENENGVRIGFTQIAGLVARRIMTFVKEGDILSKGQRFGLIRFGSRVDIYLPVGTGSRVIKGQRCVAGETVIAKLGEDIETKAIAQ
ncbi:phosphatidylserine decarboxylase [Sphingorhabdus lutea]|uniref:Phosphatidylserine decarboxylase proenzyme n=1 Tax=Sphingorhabdus lutea TaxID=1913578 RepID=A0A1L3JCG7_9SPHN|nr:phosphatidylserine decarboxylase [Sphingorhabdus lutea]APG62831.1 phosphatidylserine decarboxylase [Sphingorhabdus lutea]